ncbi:MAG TPA: hypothetical protein VFH75_07650 [Actinomycetota bacterium]|nr:hypothetical protein [Actinomycetota bacterium]
MQRRVVALTLLLNLGSFACAEEQPATPSTLTGVITRVAEAGGEVASFDLAAGEKSYEILIDPGRDYGFDLNHLYEHESTGDPVRVRLRAEDETLFALQIDDA